MRDSLSLRRNLVLRLLETTGTFKGGLTDCFAVVQEFMGVRSGCGLGSGLSVCAPQVAELFDVGSLAESMAFLQLVHLPCCLLVVEDVISTSADIWVTNSPERLSFQKL